MISLCSNYASKGTNAAAGSMSDAEKIAALEAENESLNTKVADPWPCPESNSPRTPSTAMHRLSSHETVITETQIETASGGSCNAEGASQLEYDHSLF